MKDTGPRPTLETRAYGEEGGVLILIMVLNLLVVISYANPRNGIKNEKRYN